MEWGLGRSLLVTEINHTTIINWVKEAGESLPEEPQEDEIPQRTCPHVITEIDELPTFVGSKKNKLWIWIVVNHKRKGILLSNIGDCEARSVGIALMNPLNQFGKLSSAGIVFGMLQMDGKSIRCTSNSRDHLVCKTYMTRVEGENTRLRHY